MEIRQFDDCPACGGKISTTAFSPDPPAWERFRLLSRRKYQGFMDDWPEQLSLEVRRCRSCRHLWHHTQPDFTALIGMYQSGVSLNDKDPAREPSTGMLSAMMALFNLARAHRKERPSLLDYGSGRGRWTRAAASAGFEVIAYEPSASRASEGRGDFEVVTQLEDLEGRRFDVVNLEQVLEHVQEPLEVLNGLASYLKPDSLLRITVPDISRISPDLLLRDFPFDGQRMHILSPYEHLHGFNPVSLRRLLARAGLRAEFGIRAWRTHPVQTVRMLSGPWLPRLATTHALVRPDKRMR